MVRDLIRVFYLTVTISLISSCAETKTNQCREIFDIANGTVTDAKQLTNGGKTTDPEAALLAADTLEIAAEKMASLDISDEQLQVYQQDFVEMYRDTAQATRAFVKAYEKTNPSQLKRAKQQLRKATAPEQELVNKINEYCLK